MKLEELKFSKQHEWVHLDGDIATVGISDYAQKSLGDIVFVNLPEEGDEVTQGEGFGDVESVKAVSTLYAPLSGVVSSINDELLDSPEDINNDCYKAWLIKLSNFEGYDELMSYDEYLKFIE